MTGCFPVNLSIIKSEPKANKRTVLKRHRPIAVRGACESHMNFRTARFHGMTI